MRYLATFYSHYQALSYEKEIEKIGGVGKLKSVPRSLSSSCGTCCEYERDYPIITGCEAVYEEVDGSWRRINE